MTFRNTAILFSGTSEPHFPELPVWDGRITDGVFKMEGYESLGYAIRTTCRFAVPFFFITSGYFFGVALRKGAPLCHCSGVISNGY